MRFSAPVFREGNLGLIDFNLEVGDAEKNMGLVSGEGTDTLVFRYEVKEDDADGDGVSVPANALSLGTGVTLQDGAKKDADLTHRAYGPFESHRVNAPLAEIVDIEVVSAVPDIGFHASALGHRVRFRVTFSRPVTVIAYGGGLARLTVRVGENDVTARYVGGNGSRWLTFELVPGAEHTDTDGLSVPAGALTLAGPVLLRDAEGRDAVLTHGPYGPFEEHKVNYPLPPAPHITEIKMVSEPPEGRDFYFTGDTVRVQVTFDAPVTETRPASGETGATLTLGVGEARVQAKAVIEGSTATPEFHYTVRADDLDADGVSVPADALTLAEGARLEGPHGQAAVLTHAAYGPFEEHTVNTPLPPPPHITGIEMASAVPDTGVYSSALGDAVQFRVTFSAPVTVSRFQAQLTVRLGDDDADATLDFGGGTNELLFLLIYGPQHTDSDGVSVPRGSLRLLRSTTIKGPYGQDVRLTHGSYGPFAGHLVNVDPPAPEITGHHHRDGVGGAGARVLHRGRHHQAARDVQRAGDRDAPAERRDEHDAHAARGRPRGGGGAGPTVPVAGHRDAGVRVRGDGGGRTTRTASSACRATR